MHSLKMTMSYPQLGSATRSCGFVDKASTKLYIPSPCTLLASLQPAAGHLESGQANEDLTAIAEANTFGGQVRFAGIIHPGLIGTAPSQELLEMWNKREKALVDAGEKAVSLGTVLHTRPLGERQPHAGLPVSVGIVRLWS